MIFFHWSICNCCIDKNSVDEIISYIWFAMKFVYLDGILWRIHASLSSKSNFILHRLWRTELGVLRHSNIIPWDIDCHACLMEDNYQKLLKVFEDMGIWHVIPVIQWSKWIFNQKYLYLRKDIFGIDCVSYKVHQTQTRTLMSETVIDSCPATPSSYDYLNKELFPLKLSPLLEILFLQQRSRLI